MSYYNTTLVNTLNEYIKDSKEGKITHYIITVSRDGENPPRSLMSFDTKKEALEGYDKYQDAGFAKEYITVHLYEPDGKVTKKNIRRNHAGDPSFVRQNYIDTVEALHSLKDKLSKEDYEDVCLKIVISFAKDNWRFSAERFLKQLEIEREL